MELIVDAPPSSIGRAAARALLRELEAYPKPGLVSRVDRGSHADMDASHFVGSAFVLRRHFAAFAAAGRAHSGFDVLRRIGVEAEVAMARATGGANTHRGAIFSLGLLAAAAGAHPATTLGEYVRGRWGADIAAHRRDPGSHGSRAMRISGAGGAQAQAAAGFPSVYSLGLPAYRAVRRAQGTPKHAAVQAFFALLAEVEDTNLLHRGGVEGLAFARRSARAFLEAGGIVAPGGEARALEVHREFVRRSLSPGGSADLLAATLLIATLDRSA